MHPPVLLFQLDLVLNSEEGGDLSDFITNGEWYLLGKSIFSPVFVARRKKAGFYHGANAPATALWHFLYEPTS